ncbi:hypothetical protein AERO8C_120327 [Aeromonas veronii]|uniref:Uncharacterized protein n=1 Tax=Aeromonas veronii TaxID=654 RepID=A0A653KRL1_AERVE|nr:hypothetical protein AERO8C_120327 [Aeromonas veronii]
MILVAFRTTKITLKAPYCEFFLTIQLSFTGINGLRAATYLQQAIHLARIVCSTALAYPCDSRLFVD